MGEADAARLLGRQARAVERALRRLYAPGRTRLREAIRYSLLAGGKRVRPLVVLSAGGMGRKIAEEDLLLVACAVELVHTYSLVHDDLPAMDDDDERRGRPTNHRAYGEGLAILVGDALLTDAFGVLASAERLSADRRVRLVAELASAAGEDGMVGGQALDLLSAGRAVSMRAVRDIHRKKTGALLRASARMGGIAGGADARTLERLSEYGTQLGLTFQIVDDVLDAAGGEHDGRTDVALAKGTYPSVLGLEGARRAALRAADAALAALVTLGARAEPLRLIVRRVTARMSTGT